MIWDDEKHVSFDFETDGILREYALQPWRLTQPKSKAELALPDFHVPPYRSFGGRAWPTSVSFVRKLGKKFEKRGTTMPDPSSIYLLLKEAVESDWTIVGWNLVFDIQWLLSIPKPNMRELVLKAKWLDGMLVWRHYFIEPEYDMDRTKKKSYSLKDAVREMLPQYADYEEGVTYHNPTPEELEALHDYNHKDTVFALWITRFLFTRLDPEQQRCALIEARSLPLVAISNLHGMLVDQLAAAEVGAKMEKDAAEALAILAPHGVTEKVVKSPKQLSDLMFNKWKLPILKKNKSKRTGNETNSTDKEVLHELSFKDPRAKTLRTYRDALNSKSKFVDTLITSANYCGDLRTHPQAIIFGTYSGRMTYASSQGKGKEKKQTGYAQHQMKREKMFRAQITAPDGYDIVEFDASGQEFRWMACASNDATMLGLCQPGEDPHSYMGARIEDRDYRAMLKAVKAKEEWATGPHGLRMMGKVANLSLQYRTSAPKLCSVARVQYNIPMELPTARIIHRKYQQTYPGVPIYWENQIRIVRKLGFCETFGGRRVQVTGNWNGDWGWSMGSTAINYRIQGTGADQKYLALACLKPLIVQVGAIFAWDFHDGIYFYVPKKHTERFRTEGKKILDNLPYRKAWGYTPPVPMPWDCKVGTTWGNLAEVK